MYTILFAYVKQLQIIKSMFVGKNFHLIEDTVMQT